MRALALLSTGLGCALVLGAAALLASARQAQPPQMLLLAPMLELTDTCVLPGSAQATVPQSLQAACTGGAAPSAAALVEQTLAQLPQPQPGTAAGQRYTLGYTLPIPLLQLFAQDAQGQWRIQPERVQRFVHTLRDAPQPAILYLFSTHFSAHAPLEQALAQDSANLAHAQDGPLPASQYLGSPLYPWSVARTDNALSHYRAQAIDAVAQALCEAGEPALRKLRGITLLGEVHQLFPDFETNPGYAQPYRISDYSDASVAQFRQFLQRRFGSLRALNRALHSAYTDWAQIDAPRSDLLTLPRAQWATQWPERLHSHIDAYAHGQLPVSGWAYLADEAQHAQSRILVYANGRQLARLPITQGRQDVLEARPEFAGRAVGWHTQLDYRHWPSGPQRLDFYLHTPGQALRHLDTRHIHVHTRHAPHSEAGASRPDGGALPRSMPAAATPATQLQAYVDLPLGQRHYLYNPLAEQWHAFRQQQVVRYLRHFAAQLRQHRCLADTPLYLHQIVPHTNPGWDPQKFAIQHSLQALPGLQLGVSLYGEPGMRRDFIDGLLLQGHRSYGITEFHPLKPIGAGQMHETLELHRRSGAAFFSFFLEPVWQQRPVERRANPFSLSPVNAFKGSDSAFEALRNVLQQ